MTDDTGNGMNWRLNKFLEITGSIVGFLLAMMIAIILTTGAGLAVGRFAEIVQGTISMRPAYDVWLDGWAIILGAYMLVWLPLSVLLRSVSERGS
jgi:hypothetical protein